MARYPYGPPPPAPTATPPAAAYPPYGQSQPYPSTTSRGDHGGQGHGGRGRGGHHGSGRGDYGSYHQNQAYTPPNPQPYNNPPSSSYWQGSSQMNGHANPAPMPLANYHPNYAPQGYAPPQPPPSQGYQQSYPNQPPRPAYGAPYAPTSHEYPQPQPQPWTGSPPAHTPHSGRGGRGGGYHGAQPNRQPEHMGPPIRMGFDQPTSFPQPPQPSAPGYVQSYNSHSHPQSASFQPPPYAPYSPAPPTHHGPNHGHHGPGNRGRGGFGQSNRGRHHGGEHKNRHNRSQRPNNDFNSQKSEAVQGKKKKRKTNTLGLTPDDGEESNDDEEARLMNLMGNEIPAIPAEKLPDWIAERKAKYPTKARIQAKLEAQKKAVKEAEEAKEAKEAAKADDPESQKIDDEERELLQRLREIQKSKRKRDPNDEGDEMRNTIPGAVDVKSEDDAPEVQSSRKPPPISLPSGPKRADPQAHCKYYATGGNCGKKDKCRFRHDSATRTAALEERTRNGGKMTLKQRLILNDKDADDLDVVKAIVDLRFTDRLSGLPESQEQDKETAPSTASTSTLPGSSGAANLPPNPTTTHQTESKS